MEPDPERPPPRLLLAGSSSGERVPVTRGAAQVERWFEPLHVRDPVASRERIAAQVAAGADIVLAPTWRTHRRALIDVGESRRAREWTEAAVRVAREGVDAGMEREPVTQDQTAHPEAEAEASPPTPLPPREPPLVAGVLPSLDDEPESGSGRLLPREPAAARDIEEVAGHLADADVDLILVEARLDAAALRVAVEAAARTGVATWVAATGPLPDEADVERGLATWVETAIGAGAVGLLLPDGTAETAARIAEGVADANWGGLVGETGERSPERLGERAAAWLDAGATAIGLLRGAHPERLGAIRAAIDKLLRAEIEQEQVGSARWDAVVARGAAMAPGGAALWIAASAPSPATLPAGFAWAVAGHAEAHRFPRERYRLIVLAAGTGMTSAEVAGLLESGGILVAAHEASRGPGASLESLRLVSTDAAAHPLLAIYRRES